MNPWFVTSLFREVIKNFIARNQYKSMQQREINANAVVCHVTFSSRQTAGRNFASFDYSMQYLQ